MICTKLQRTRLEDACTRLRVQLTTRVAEWREFTPLVTRERIPAPLQFAENFGSVGDDEGCLCHNL
jgi:hypothetical protein